ncbi:15985_t:CDS:10 [Funneliformis mosseae]|uniref:15985_t:CDS:1 n=1 Tax=Funneliformis mosseae TaxID=27381 RepID=A0A9N9F625_FUNMO|nr:15985_t:CDS:10 [Funneliformis mosseae]
MVPVFVRYLGCLVLLMFLPQTHSLFQREKYTTSALYLLKDVGLGDISGTVAAFADFNSDKYTDLFVLSSDQRSLSVYLWDHADYKFTISPSANITISQNEENSFIITNILPGDYDYDGNLDILVMGQTNPSSNDRKKEPLFMRVYFGYGNDTFNPNFINVPSATYQQPIPFDFDGDMKIDLIGHSFDKGVNELSIWQNIYNNGTTDLFQVKPLPLQPASDVPPCILSEPHSNAFIDLNGDCRSDLFLTCQDTSGKISYQIWTSTINGYVFSKFGDLPQGVGQISFADMDGDGTLDMVFPVCNNGCKIHVAYNNQIPLCENKNSKNCRKVSELCIADDNFSFDMTTDASNSNYVVLDLQDELPTGEDIVLLDPDFNGILPVSLRIGDYNLDGYPDLLVVTSNGKESHVTLLESILCTTRKCHGLAAASQRRTFVKVNDGAQPLYNIKTAKNAAFLDLDEDGTMDIMVFTATHGKTAARDIQMIHNNYFNDAFFLKTLVLNGVGHKQNFGVNYPGAEFKFTVLDTSGRKRANQVAQYSQSGYLSLQTPYSLFGLGRTNNYVEELFVGVSRNQSSYYTSLAGVIPNSQLIIVPYQPEGVDNPTSWSIELYIHPGDWVPWVLMILIIVTIILAIVVFILNYIEKREDEYEKRKASRFINFDAL